MDYQLTNFIVILHRAIRIITHIVSRRWAKNRAAREKEKEGEKERERKSKSSIREACEFVWEVSPNETLRHRGNHRGAKLFSLFFGGERRRGKAWRGRGWLESSGGRYLDR